MAIQHVKRSQPPEPASAQRDSRILVRVCEIVSLAKDADTGLRAAGEHDEYELGRLTGDPSLCFALARTRARPPMGAFIAYLYQGRGSATFPSGAEPDELQQAFADFTPSSQVCVQGDRRFYTQPPVVITGETMNRLRRARRLLFSSDDCHINILTFPSQQQSPAARRRDSSG